MLDAFAREMDGRPVSWGENDCSAAPALWLRRLGWKVALPIYRSREEAHAIIAAHGSLAATWENCISGSGMAVRIGEPQLGDVAVIETRLFGQIGGIVASGSILLVRQDDGGWRWFGPARRFAEVWAAT
jgi:hypothetical protein